MRAGAVACATFACLAVAGLAASHVTEWPLSICLTVGGVACFLVALDFRPPLGGGRR